MEGASAVAHDITLQLNRSIDVIDRMMEALGRATFSQDELIAKWRNAQDRVAQEAAVMAELQHDPEAALAEAKEARALIQEIKRLPRQAFSVKFFVDVFRDRLYMKALSNSLLLGFATVITTSIIGFTVAYLLVRYDFPGRKAFSFLTTVPIVMPPTSWQRVWRDRGLSCRTGCMITCHSTSSMDGTGCCWWRRVTCSRSLR